MQDPSSVFHQLHRTGNEDKHPLVQLLVKLSLDEEQALCFLIPNDVAWMHNSQMRLSLNAIEFYIRYDIFNFYFLLFFISFYYPWIMIPVIKIAVSSAVTCSMAIVGFDSFNTKNIIRLSTVAAITKIPPNNPLCALLQSMLSWCKDLIGPSFFTIMTLSIRFHISNNITAQMRLNSIVHGKRNGLASVNKVFNIPSSFSSWSCNSNWAISCFVSSTRACLTLKTN